MMLLMVVMTVRVEKGVRCRSDAGDGSNSAGWCALFGGDVDGCGCGASGGAGRCGGGWGGMVVEVVVKVEQG